MTIKEIHYNPEFMGQFKRMPPDIKRRALKQELMLKSNPFHPSLRLHKLHGKLGSLWSVSVSRGYRIIFMPLNNGIILFVSIGKHAIYEK
jgi:mRNA-degrading endonuclease RelE of RelBE toxin-antitoxin system